MRKLKIPFVWLLSLQAPVYCHGSSNVCTQNILFSIQVHPYGIFSFNIRVFFSFQNLKRVAEVWMDEYAEYIYQRRPEYRHLSAGDMSAQKELRIRLNCMNFKWFMDKVAWDLPKHYPPVEPPAGAWGEVQSAPIP